jgi:hypothetical protein
MRTRTGTREMTAVQAGDSFISFVLLETKIRKKQYLSLQLFQAMLEKVVRIRLSLRLVVSIVYCNCAHRGVPPLAARLPLGRFS